MNREMNLIPTPPKPDGAEHKASDPSAFFGLPSGAWCNPDMDRLLQLWELLCDERAISQLDMTAALKIARDNEYLSNRIRRRLVFSTAGAPDRCHQTAIRRSHSSIPFSAPRSGHAKWLQTLSDRSYQALCERSSRPLYQASQPKTITTKESV